MNASKRKWLNLARNTVAALLSCAITLVGAEMICEYSESPELLRKFNDTPHPFMDYDPQMGWKIRPDTHGTFFINNTPSQIYDNHLGMRYHEVGPKTGFRVAVLGDSITWGYSVDNDQRFTDRIEQAFHIDVLNFAVMGYGPLQYYLQLDDVIAQSPDMVVVAFTLYNDFEDNIRNTNAEFYRPYADLQNGQIAVLGQPAPDYRKFTMLKKPDYTAKYALGRLFYDTLRQISPPIFNFVFSNNTNYPEKIVSVDFKNTMLYSPQLTYPAYRALEINKAILKAIRDKLTTKNIKMMILACSTEPDQNDNTLHILQAQASELGIPITDIPNFEHGEKYTFPDHVHWRPAGHQLAAEALSNALKPYLPNP